MAAALALTVIAGCGKKDDPIAKAEKKDVAKGVAAPGIAETKAIAEEGVHLRPAARDELRGDVRVRRGHEVQPVQGALQPDQQHAPRRDLRRHGGRHAEQRHALLDALAGSARGADGDLGAGGGEGALLLGAVDRRQYLQLWLHRQPRHGERRRATTSSSAPTGKARRPPGSRRSFPRRLPSRSPSFGPSSSIPQTCRTWRRCRRATRRSRFPRSSSNPRRRPRRRSISSRPPPRGSRRTSSSISTLPSSSSRRRRRTRRSGPNSPVSASGRARPSSSRISRRNTRPPSCRA